MLVDIEDLTRWCDADNEEEEGAGLKSEVELKNKICPLEVYIYYVSVGRMEGHLRAFGPLIQRRLMGEFTASVFHARWKVEKEKHSSSGHRETTRKHYWRWKQTLFFSFSFFHLNQSVSLLASYKPSRQGYFQRNMKHEFWSFPIRWRFCFVQTCCARPILERQPAPKTCICTTSRCGWNFFSAVNSFPCLKMHRSSGCVITAWDGLAFDVFPGSVTRNCLLLAHLGSDVFIAST